VALVAAPLIIAGLNFMPFGDERDQMSL
jgi:hypothetical protein